MNKIILIGRLGKDPELKTLQSGEQLCSFSLATSEKYKNKAGETVENTEWHDCSIFGKRAEIFSKFVKRGHQVCVEGKITSRVHEDKKYTSVRVTDFYFLDNKKEEEDLPY